MVITKKTAAKLKSRVKEIRELPKTPLWSGPCSDLDTGGCTQSMISSYIVCQERFLIKAIKGLKPQQGFSHSMEYGNMWHVCEEALAGNNRWEKPLKDYVVRLSIKYPNDRWEIEKWYNVCRVTFPTYVKYWSKHKDVKNRTPIFQEKVFKISYELPSGRIVLLRGKFDSVDLIGKNEIYLMENKTKSDIEEQKLKQELPNTLQPMIYLTALSKESLLAKHFAKGVTLAGVRYNVARRPLGGGKHSISQHKGRKTKTGIVGAETKAMFYERLGGLIEENASHFFMRWKCDITSQDLARFQKEVIDPVLENLCDWYEWMEYCCSFNVDRFDSSLRNNVYPHHVPRVWRLPFGLYNPLLEGRNDEYSQYLTTGSMSGMQKVTTLFPELAESE